MDDAAPGVPVALGARHGPGVDVHRVQPYLRQLGCQGGADGPDRSTGSTTTTSCLGRVRQGTRDATSSTQELARRGGRRRQGGGLLLGEGPPRARQPLLAFAVVTPGATIPAGAAAVTPPALPAA